MTFSSDSSGGPGDSNSRAAARRPRKTTRTPKIHPGYETPLIKELKNEEGIRGEGMNHSHWIGAKQ
jgi:hypothetical protein